MMTKKTVLFTLAVLLVGVAGYFDWLTGPEIDFALFFLIPVCWVTWQIGQKEGIAIALLSGMADWAADMIPNLSFRTASFWFIPY